MTSQAIKLELDAMFAEFADRLGLDPDEVSRDYDPRLLAAFDRMPRWVKDQVPCETPPAIARDYWRRNVELMIIAGAYVPPPDVTVDDIIAGFTWYRDEWRLETPEEVEARLSNKLTPTQIESVRSEVSDLHDRIDDVLDERGVTLSPRMAASRIRAGAVDEITADEWQPGDQS